MWCPKLGRDVLVSFRGTRFVFQHVLLIYQCSAYSDSSKFLLARSASKEPDLGEKFSEMQNFSESWGCAFAMLDRSAIKTMSPIPLLPMYGLILWNYFMLLWNTTHFILCVLICPGQLGNYNNFLGRNPSCSFLYNSAYCLLIYDVIP